MQSSDRESADFRRKLIRRLNQFGKKFDFSMWVEETDIDPQLASHAAETVFARLFARVLADGEITQDERWQLRMLAGQLQISLERREEIESSVGKQLLRERQREAKADGVIDDEERKEIERLKQALGLLRNQKESRPDEKATDADRSNAVQRAARRKEREHIAERDNILALVRSSPQFERRESPQRLKRARARGQQRKLFLFTLGVTLTGITLMSAVTLAIVGNATEDAKILLGIASIAGLAFCGISSPLVWIFYWGIHRKRAFPINSAALVVHSKRVAGTKVDGYSTEQGRFYYATFEGNKGRRVEYELCDAAMAERLMIGDAGIVFIQEDRVIDFDCVHTAETTRERHIQGAVVCSNCHTVYELDGVPKTCRNCGRRMPEAAFGQEKLVERRIVNSVFSGMERFSERMWQRSGMLHEIGSATLKQQVEGHVTCGWCRRRYGSRPDGTDCARCGGVLPMPPGHDRGPKPPPAPRKLPGAIYAMVYWKSNGLLKTGLQLLAGSFCCCFFPPISLILFFCGFMSVIHGLIVARRRIAALSRGVAVPGQIENIQWMGNLPTQERGTRRVFYRFEADGEPLRAMFYSLDSSIEDRFTGEPIWVVTVPGKPHLCAAWPPFA